MKALLTLLTLCVLAVSPAAWADDITSPEDQYVKIYGLILQADKAVENGRTGSALTNYTRALADLKKLKTDFPEWNTKVVKYRLDYLTARLAPAPGTNLPPAMMKSTAPGMSAESSEPVEMKLNWELGKRYVQHVDMTQSSEVNMAGQPQPMRQESKVSQDIAISVLKEREGGGRELEMEILGIAMDMGTGAAARTSFDSKKPVEEDGNNPLAPAFRKMVGGRVKFLSDANGKIESVEGMQDLASRVAGTNAAVAGMMKELLSEENLKQMTPLTQGLPVQPVKIGDTWPMRTQTSMGPMGTLSINLKYTFKGWEQHDNRKCAVLEFTGDVTAKPGEAGATDAMISIDQGKSSGKTWFDPAIRMVVGTTANQDMNMKVNAPQGQSMSTRLHQVVSAKLVEIADIAK